MLKQDVDQK